MRELLFRGFHTCDGPETVVVDGEKVNGRWVYGYYVGPVKGLIAHEICDTDDVMGHSLDVLTSTVGQYTGLTDKNGKRIFEGDRIKWDEKEWGRPFTESVIWDYSLLDERKNDWGEFCEVIGTIFDEEKSHEN